MDQVLLRAYAHLLLNTGVALQKGQKLDVGYEYAHREFVEILAEEAYKLGAGFVHARLVSPSLTRIRAAHSTPDALTQVPRWLEAQWQTIVDEDWAVIALTGAENPHELEGVDPGALGAMQAALAAKRSSYLVAQTKSQFCWTVAGVPTDGWARQVLGPDATASSLWQVLSPILGLDEPDAAASWQTRIQTLNARCRHLTSLKVDTLHFTGPGTDLRVGLMDRSRWRGGDEQAANGRRFAPNLPTEEVFTTPDWRRTEGHAVCTRPVEVMGAGVEGVELSFREGRVVDFSARKNQNILAAYLKQDGQSNALGEVALVDGASRIFQSGKIFHNILFDENAACHIALGTGYPDAVEGGREADSDQLLAWGCNQSRVHTDFMIGGPEVSIDAVLQNGTTVRLVEKGTFRLGNLDAV